MSTAVVVPVPASRKDALVESITEFKTRHLYFTGLDATNRDIRVQFETPTESFSRTTWPEDTGDPRPWSIVHWKSAELRALAHDAEHEISEPGAAVAWPPQHQAAIGEDEEGMTPAVYGYLPTLVDGPFGADFQGDFQLSIDRTNLRLDDDTMGPYNKRLIQAGTELHLLQAFQREPELTEAVDWDVITPDAVEHAPAGIEPDSERPDLWYFLNPGFAKSKAGEIAVEHLAQLLFDPECGRKDPAKYALWAQFVAGYFDQRDRWPEETYRSFWTAVLEWVDYLWHTQSRSKTWREVAEAMCDALREKDAAVAAIVEDGGHPEGVEAVPLPATADPVAEGGQPERKDRAVFVRTADDGRLALPTALQADDRAVTTYEFPSVLYEDSPNALGATPFNRWAVLSELRQLPNSLDGWSYDPLVPPGDDNADAGDRQRELIRFAAQLYRLETGGSQDPPATTDAYDTGWRMRNEFSPNARRAGRALATLFLPTTDGKWEPARQLTRDRVDVDHLGTAADEVDIESFLAFLGVAPPAPEDGVQLTLVEGGPDGRVDARSRPPTLAAAGRGLPDATLGDLPSTEEPASDPHAWQRSLQAAWDDWLEPLATLEREALESEELTSRTSLCDTLGNRPWVPVAAGDDTTGVAPPEPDQDPPAAVSPEDVTLHVPQQTQYPTLLWSLTTTADAAVMLRQLGAIAGLDEDILQANSAAPAFRLLETLRALDPSSIADPRRQQTLVNLFDRILNAVVEGDSTNRGATDLWLLTHRRADADEGAVALAERHLSWRSLDEPGWVAGTPADQEMMRRYFPTVPLVAGTVPPQSLEQYPPLADRAVRVDRTVHSDPPGGVHDDAAEAVADQFGSLAPQLLALADATRPFDIDLETVADHWSPDRFRHADNVWREVTATLAGETRTEQELENEHGRALITGDDYRTIIFDSEDETRYPSLDTYGEPLAELLLEDQGREVGDLFARALQIVASEDMSLAAFVDSKGATPLVDTYERVFDQLTDEERELLRDATAAALDAEDITLTTDAVTHLRRLTPRDIEVPDSRRALTESDINNALNAVTLPETRDWEWYRPHFQCYETHTSEWQSWFADHEDQLVAYLLTIVHRGGLGDYDTETLTDQLNTYVRDNECAKVTFQPEVAVVNWLDSLPLDIEASEIPAPESLKTEFDAHSATFNPIQEIKDITDTEFTEKSPEPATPSTKGGGVFNLEADTEKKRTQMAYGQEAEDVARTDIVDRTVDALKTVQDSPDPVLTVQGTEVTDVEDVIDVLCWPFYDGGVTETHVREHLKEYAATGDPEALGDALHISNVWDGAGFDLIGLEFVNERLQPVRYEIKALSGNLSEAKAYLSKNQYAMYQAVHDDEQDDQALAGEWRLQGVTESGVAYDLTNSLAALPDDALAALRDNGFDHDGLVLTLERMQDEN
ncbi:hypothetical protein PNP59_11080 [Halobacterium salinarum]|uniref:hypothetical protein n=1 Tax=Halobacterium salinarum TaxID=2242 RepID=UPI00255253A1|nr:hypothetical protein [Halobacterium salinarum]MDL0131471.1 hypothetical protein [Halobacterium salinarum]